MHTHVLAYMHAGIKETSGYSQSIVHTYTKILLGKPALYTVNICQ